MARIFSFERDVYATLELVPLAVRRKLDLACLKLSLRGWQALPLADRRALCDAPVDDGASVVAFASALRAASARAGVPLDELPDGGAPWRSRSAPDAVRARGAALGAQIDDAAWAGLDDEDRYALVNLCRDRRAADDDHGRDRLRAALVELGLASV